MMIPSIATSRVMEIWEQSIHQLPARRALSLLAGLTTRDVAIEELPPGERDRKLLLIRKQLFGDQILAVTECPSCSGRLEIVFSVAELCSGHPATTYRQSQFVTENYEVRWRLPTAADLADLAEQVLPDQIRHLLLERCVDVRHGNHEIGVSDCPPTVIQAVCDAMAEADPYGDMRLDLNCPECGYAWKAIFDADAFLWREIDAWARRLLSEVHCLAASYGWSESDILAMSDQRRQSYLELIQ